MPTGSRFSAGGDTPKIYQVCSSKTNPVTLAEAGVAVMSYFRDDPPSATTKVWSSFQLEEREVPN